MCFLSTLLVISPKNIDLLLTLKLFADASEPLPRPMISIEMDQETCGGKTHGKWDGVLGEVDGIEANLCSHVDGVQVILLERK